MRPVILLFAIALAGCASKPVEMGDGSFLYNHGVFATEAVLHAANERCAAEGKIAVQLDTDCGARCVSKFRCE